MLEAAGIGLAGIFVADLRHGAEQHGAGRGVVHVDEIELGLDLVVVDAGELGLTLLVDSTPWWQVMQRASAPWLCDLQAGRKGDAGERERLVVVAGDAGDDGADRRRMIDLAGGGAVGAEIVAEAGRRMAARAFDRNSAFLVPVVERLGAGAGMRRARPFGIERHLGGRTSAACRPAVAQRLALGVSAVWPCRRRRLRAQARRRHHRAAARPPLIRAAASSFEIWPWLRIASSWLDYFACPPMPDPRMNSMLGGTGACTRLKWQSMQVMRPSRSSAWAARPRSLFGWIAAAL